MEKPTREQVWNFFRKYLFNKYVAVLLVFALLMTFCGEQSLLNRVRRAHEIAQKEAELKEYNDNIEAANAEIQRLNQSSENLEQFAREKYHMHADDEDVYLIDEE